jgi:hypothetical protein
MARSLRPSHPPGIAKVTGGIAAATVPALAGAAMPDPVA